MCNEKLSEQHIRPMAAHDIERIVDIAELAWRPIYEHFCELQERALGTVARPANIERKRKEVRAFAERHPEWVLVTELDGEVVGFLTFTLDQESKIGEIGNNAIHPAYHNRGLGSAQYRKALEVFRQAGMRFAAVTTGLDNAHAPARRAYERVGFVQVRGSVEYMMKL